MIEFNQLELDLSSGTTWFKSLIKCNNNVNLNIVSSLASVLDFNKVVLRRM